MRLRSRSTLGALLAGCVLALCPGGAHAAFGVAKFEAGTCTNKTCTYASIEGKPSEAFTQSAGHPPWGITTFELNHTGGGVPEGELKRIRVDVPEGLAANPQALPTCKKATFEASPKLCPLASEVGEVEMDAVAEPLGVPLALSGLKGKVYNLELE